METTSLPAGAGPPARPVIMVRGKVYEPAVGPKLRVLLFLNFAFFALLGATGFYMLVVRKLELNTFFSIVMFAVHNLAGVIIIPVFLIFGLIHFIKSRHRKNRLAVKLGVVLFFTGIGILLTGVALFQIEGLPQLPTTSFSRFLVLFLHAALPVAAVVVYVLHRRAGPDIQWKWGVSWAAAVGVFVAIMTMMHSHDPNRQFAKGSHEGEQYFHPSMARTPGANFIPEHVLMADKYCMKCHADIYKDHLHSSHKFSSFNNPAYLFSVRETRRVAGVRAARWCAGCHDPVPFFGGKFDDPNYDDVNDPTAHAGITCTACHSITHVASRSGNADYTISEPIHYPFAFSDNPFLQWINNQLIKAKPDFHKQMFLKPLHKTEAFCSTCHKVALPQELNRYKEFLRGQDHNTSFHLSGIGHGARSFYYPDKAKANCSDCHMPLKVSNDFGSRYYDDDKERKVHNHLFLGGNVGVATLAKYPNEHDIIKAQADFLRTGFNGKAPTLRIDLFGVKLLKNNAVYALPVLLGVATTPAGGPLAAALVADQLEERGIESPLIGNQPLRPALPTLVPGNTYQFEVVVRTLNIGHHFTQGTADSNEVWVDFQVKSGGRLLARSGGMDEGEDQGRVDASAHFINVYMLDRHGNRIDRRNPQDIFTPLYNHQIPPGSANVLHYRLEVPHDLKPDQPIELSVRVRYRKFDYAYMEIVYGKGNVPKLPIIDMCADSVTLPVAGRAKDVPAQQSPIKPGWQRWNDYGIGCFLEGGPTGKENGELGQAEQAFSRLLSPEFAEVTDAHSHGNLNMARVHLAYGGRERFAMARQALDAAEKCDPPAPWWTVSWFRALAYKEDERFPDRFDRAIAELEKILRPVKDHPKKIRDVLEARKFDFTSDYVVINELGQTLFARSQLEDDKEKRNVLLRQAIAQFEKTLEIDAEDVVAHEFLVKCYSRLAEERPAEVASKTKAAQSATKSESDQRVLDLLARVGRAVGSQDSVDAAHELSVILGGPEAKALSLATLLTVREKAGEINTRSRSEWLPLALAPGLSAIDRRLLDEAMTLAQQFAGRSAKPGDGAVLEDVLDQLYYRPRLGNVRPTFLALTTLPQQGLAVSNALATLADHDFLGGGLPPTRLLTLVKVRQIVHPMKNARGADTNEAVRLLARLHQMLHAIYKPDENAQGHALRIARERNPAAARASQSVIIYDLK